MQQDLRADGDRNRLVHVYESRRDPQGLVHDELTAMRRVLFSAAALLFAGSAAATHVTVAVARHGDVPPVDVTLAGSMTSVVVRIPEAPTAAPTVDLEPGHWCVQVDPSVVWLAPRCIDVGREPVVTSLDLRPSGVLTGTISTTAKISPNAVDVRFEGNAADEEHVEGIVTCPVGANGVFRCSLPAGILNLSVHLRHHISRYLQRVHVDRGAPRNIGQLVMGQGSAIAGKVELPAEMRDFRGVTVTAEPSGVHEGNGPPLAGSSLLKQTATVETNGWFHIDGVMPAEYLLHAAGPRLLRSANVAVTVRSLAETRLTDPLRLEHPRHIACRITPHVAPDGSRWHVTVSREVAVGRLDTVSQALASPDGHWISQALQPATYVVEVGTTANDDVWSSEIVDSVPGDQERNIVIATRTLAGTVRLGDKALAAQLTFSDEKRRRISTESSDDGRFSVTVPGDDFAWDVQVRRNLPSVQRVLHKLRCGDDGTLNITIPATALTGTVVDENDAPVLNALVTIHATSGLEPLNQPMTHEDGAFEAVGLAAGQYVVSAETGDSKSAAVRVELREDETAQTVKLTLRKAHALRGRVISPLGPVAAATVTVVPTDTVSEVMTSVMTDANGAFAVSLGRDVHEIDVLTAAAGFAYTLDHVPVRDQPLTVAVEQAAGTLTLRADAGKHLLLHHGSASVVPSLLTLQWTATSSLDANGRLTIVAPMMDPGSYSLCDEARRCVNGVLDPFGSLSLKLD